jgi:peptidoglycan/LPS O-acetylase OafA/YrhL
MQPELSRRPDIDGLRAIAIIAVVGFHAFPQAFPGGFVGVDVFFVLSGFLITSIIVSGLARGSFSFLEFYARRTRRIFPALIIVLAACLAVGWFDLLPGEYTALGKHTVAGSTFLTNVVQWSEAGYFDPSAQSKPLLHLWSLGIEEQFYLAWPLVAFVAWRFGKKVFAAAAMIVIVSFLICLKITAGHPVTAFYLPWSRAWELLLGGCVATMPPFRYPVYMAVRNTASVAGAVLIVSAVAMFDDHSVYPGWRAAVPTIGTALMLWAGSDAVLNRRLLKLPVMVRVGLISYPLYLWHWPILSYLWIVGDSTVATRAIGLVLSVALAWATYRFVEFPMRRANLRISIPLIGGISAIALIGVAVFTGALPANPKGAPRTRYFSLGTATCSTCGRYCAVIEERGANLVITAGKL